MESHDSTTGVAAVVVHCLLLPRLRAEPLPEKRRSQLHRTASGATAFCPPQRTCVIMASQLHHLAQKQFVLENKERAERERADDVVLVAWMLPRRFCSWPVGED